MPFPEGWPPRFPNTSTRSLRFYAAGTAGAAYDAAAYLFAAGAGANPYTPLPVVAPGSSTPVDISSPMGTGRAAVDANMSQTDPTKQALPVAAIWSQSIRVCNDGGGDLEISFDGVNVADTLKANEQIIYATRREAGIALRGAGVAFRVSAW